MSGVFDTAMTAAKVPMWSLTAYGMTLGVSQRQAEREARRILDAHGDEEPSLESLLTMYREMRDAL